jgi:hypothetical protein
LQSIFRGEISEEIAMKEILIQRGAHGIVALSSAAAAAAAFMASCNPGELCNIQDKDKERRGLLGSCCGELSCFPA